MLLIDKGVYNHACDRSILRSCYIRCIFNRRQHNPPHFHVVYGEYIGAFEIQTLWMMEGGLPVKAQALVQEWAAQHTEELLRIWNTQEFIKLPPLE